MPDGGGQPSSRVQGAAERPRGPLAGFEGRIPLRVLRAGASAVRTRGARGTSRPAPVPRVRGADDRRYLRLLQPAGARNGERRRHDRGRAPAGPSQQRPPAGTARHGAGRRAQCGRRRTGGIAERRPFTAGDRVLLVDSKRRRHLVTLSEGGAFHSHNVVVDHQAIIGKDEGVTVRTTMGARLVAVRPTLAEYVLK